MFNSTGLTPASDGDRSSAASSGGSHPGSTNTSLLSNNRNSPRACRAPTSTPALKPTFNELRTIVAPTTRLLTSSSASSGDALSTMMSSKQGGELAISAAIAGIAMSARP